VYNCILDLEYCLFITCLYFEQIELAAKLLEYFLWIDKSNINQSHTLQHTLQQWCDKSNINQSHTLQHTLQQWCE